MVEVGRLKNVLCSKSFCSANDWSDHLRLGRRAACATAVMENLASQLATAIDKGFVSDTLASSLRGHLAITSLRWALLHSCLRGCGQNYLIRGPESDADNVRCLQCGLQDLNARHSVNHACYTGRIVVPWMEDYGAIEASCITVLWI